MASEGSQGLEEALLRAGILYNTTGGVASSLKTSFSPEVVYPISQGGELHSCLSEPFAKSPADRLWETLWPSQGVLGADVHLKS